MNRHSTSTAPCPRRLVGRLRLHAAGAAAASLFALPAQACDSTNRVVPVAINFTARIPFGTVINNLNPLGCNDGPPPLVIETGGVLNNFANLTNEPSFGGGPNDFGGLSVANGLLDNKFGATLTNLGDFYVSYRASPVQGAFINSGTFVNSALFSNWGNVTSTGVIDNRSAAFESHSNNFTIAGGSFDNSGTATFQFSFINRAVVNNTGTFIADDFGFAFYNQGTFNNAAGGTLRLNGGGGVLDMSGGSLNNRGSLRVNGGMYVGDPALYGTLNLLAGGEFEGGLEVAQSYRQVNSGLLRSNTRSSIYGTLDNRGSFISDGELLNRGLIDNSGSFVVNGAFGFDGGFVNTGTAVFAVGSQTSGVGSYTQTAGRTYLDGNIAALQSIDILGGDFCGTGSTASVLHFVNNGGNICPGHSPGTLHIGGDLDFISGSLLMEIAGTAAGQFDVLRIDGRASFTSGVLTLSFLDGYVPRAGDHWGLFEFSGGVAGLSNLTLQTEGLPAGYALGFSLSPTGELAVTAVPEPTSMALFLAGLAAISLRSTRRAFTRARETA